MKYVNQWYNKEDYCRGHTVNNPNKVRNVDCVFNDDTWFCPVCGDEGNENEVCHECGEVEYMSAHEPVPGFCPRCGSKTNVGMLCVRCPKYHETGHWSYGRAFKPDGDITDKIGAEENPDIPPSNNYNRHLPNSSFKRPSDNDDESSASKKPTHREAGFVFIDHNMNNDYDPDESVIDLTLIKDSDTDGMSISISSGDSDEENDSDDNSTVMQCKVFNVNKAFRQVSVGEMTLHLLKSTPSYKARHSSICCHPCGKTGH